MHPFLTRALENIVEVIHNEYISNSYVIPYGYLRVVCATGPGVLTASAVEVILQQPNVSYRLLSGRMMRGIGAKNSIYFNRGNATSYYHLLSGRYRENLLVKYMAKNDTI